MLILKRRTMRRREETLLAHLVMRLVIVPTQCWSVGEAKGPFLQSAEGPLVQQGRSH